MALEDHNVHIITVKRPRGEETLQYRGVMNIASFRGEVARRKRTKLSGLVAYARLEDEYPLVQDERLFLFQDTRGGAGLQVCIIHPEEGKITCSIGRHTQVDELLHKQGWSQSMLTFNGSRLPMVARLHDYGPGPFGVADYDPEQQTLRTLTTTFQMGWISLAELCTWFQNLMSSEEDGWTENPQREDIIAIRWRACEQQWRTWKFLTARSISDTSSSSRGGAPKQALPPWESTRTISGMKLVTDLTTENVDMKCITLDEVVTDAAGFAFGLLRSWPKLSEIKSQYALLIIFPGRCQRTLEQLGAPKSELQETEVIVASPEDNLPKKKHVTILNLSDKPYELAKKMRTVQWTPQTNVEIQAEFDARWGSPMLKQEAEKDWQGLALRLLTAMLQATVSKEQVYAWRLPPAQPLIPLWSCRLRLTMEDAEKIIGASGLDAMFTRATDPTAMHAHQDYTIVWSSRHQDAAPGVLTPLLHHARQIPGHRGAARSLAGIGLRTPWQKVREARTLLCPGDSRYHEGNIAIKDAQLYKAEGCPPGASSSDVAKFLKELPWQAFPQRRQVYKDTATWWISSEGPPPATCLRWGTWNVVLHQEDQEELRRKRARANNKKMNATTKAVVESSAVKADPLHGHDPWARYASARQATTASMPASSSTSVDTNFHDQRVSQLFTRMQAVETKHEALEQKVDNIGAGVEQISSNMGTQFSQVLQAIAELTQTQEHSRKRPADSTQDPS